MCMAWSRSRAPGGSIVTNGRSTRSAAGGRAAAASASTSAGNASGTPASRRIASKPCSSVAAGATRMGLGANRVPGGLELGQRLEPGQRAARRTADALDRVGRQLVDRGGVLRLAGGVDDGVDVAVAAQRGEQLVEAAGQQVQDAARDVRHAGDLAEVQGAQGPAARD